MAESEQYILVIQPDDFQRLIWETVLRSQNLNVFVDNSGRSPMATLASYSAQGQDFDLVLVDWDLVQEQWLGWLTLCERQMPPLKTVLLLAQNIDSDTRRVAVESGAISIIDWVSDRDPTSSVISGTRRILQHLTGISLDKEALVASLLGFKRLLENGEQTFSSEGPSSSAADDDNVRPETEENASLPRDAASPETAPSDEPHNRRSDGRRRRYRGRTY